MGGEATEAAKGPGEGKAKTNCIAMGQPTSLAHDLVEQDRPETSTKETAVAGKTTPDSCQRDPTLLINQMRVVGEHMDDVPHHKAHAHGHHGTVHQVSYV